MSVGTLTFQLPFRACIWIKYLAGQRKQTVRQWVLEAVLRQLQSTPGVDLSRHPESIEEGWHGEGKD
jgi:hypothetical protein